MSDDMNYIHMSILSGGSLAATAILSWEEIT